MKEELQHYKDGDSLVYLQLDPSSIYFQFDQSRRSTKNPDARRVEADGHLDPVAKVRQADVYPVHIGKDSLPGGLILVSMPYIWDGVYINSIRDEYLTNLYYDLPIRGCDETIGDRFKINFTSATTRKLAVVSGLAEDAGPLQVLVGGTNSDLVIRKGMGVSFRNRRPDAPSQLQHLQGLVVEVCVERNEVVVQIVLNKTNLPEYMGLDRLGLEQVLQTRLKVHISNLYADC